MNYRAFIRFSIDGDDGTLTTYLSNLLTKTHGFTKVGTGEYQTHGRMVQDVSAAMQEFWNAVASPAGAFPGATLPAHVRVDHIWTYSGTD